MTRPVDSYGLERLALDLERELARTAELRAELARVAESRTRMLAQLDSALAAVPRWVWESRPATRPEARTVTP